jgi:hypothetical protein
MTDRMDMFEKLTDPMRVAEAACHFMKMSEQAIVDSFLTLPGATAIKTNVGVAVWVRSPKWRKNGSVLFVAHYDTVWGTKPVQPRIVGSKTAPFIESGLVDVGIGADDRAGILGLWMLASTAYENGHDLLIVPAEEVGCQGSGWIALNRPRVLLLRNGSPRYAFAIQFDRRGAKDLVRYDCDNAQFDAYCRGKFPGYKLAGGSFSDIAELCPEGGFAGVNVSIGFDNEHTAFETLDVLDFIRTISNARRIARAGAVPAFAYKARKYESIVRALPPAKNGDTGSAIWSYKNGKSSWSSSGRGGRGSRKHWNDRVDMEWPSKSAKDSAKIIMAAVERQSDACAGHARDLADYALKMEGDDLEDMIGEYGEDIERHEAAVLTDDYMDCMSCNQSYTASEAMWNPVWRCLTCPSCGNELDRAV